MHSFGLGDSNKCLIYKHRPIRHANSTSQNFYCKKVRMRPTFFVIQVFFLDKL